MRLIRYERQNSGYRPDAVKRRVFFAQLVEFFFNLLSAVVKSAFDRARRNGENLRNFVKAFVLIMKKNNARTHLG